jgi:putative transposase
MPFETSVDEAHNERPLRLSKHGIECSMSSSGNHYDNACVESFFASLMREHVNRVRHRTRDRARADIVDYMEVFYNRKQRQGYIGNIRPDNYEKQSTGSL